MPISDKQQKILAFPYSRYNTLICDGSVRSGKTSLMTVAYVNWAMDNFDRQNFIFVGNTVGAITRNVIDPYRFTRYARDRYIIDFNRSSGKMIVRSAESENYFHVFGAKNARSYEIIQGMTAAGCFVDEVAICDKQAVETALSRCSVDGARYWFNCNPSYPKHWFREEWILDTDNKNALYLHFTMEDNPGLSESTRKRYESQFKGVFYDRYIKGLWVVAEGLVYQFDSQDEYTCSPEEAIGDGSGEWFISLDYGITNPFAAILWRISGKNAYAVAEYYHDSRRLNYRKTDSEHYKSVENLAGDRNIQTIVIDPSANSFKEEIWRNNRFDCFDADNSVIDGIRITDTMLHDGTIKISTDCSNTIMEMGMYRWDNKEDKDQVIKENDHAMDAMRYMANSILKYDLPNY